jgi:hypothetical protein
VEQTPGLIEKIKATGTSNPEVNVFIMDCGECDA